MSRYDDQVLDEFGRVVPGVTIYVYDDAEAIDVLTADDASPLPNPLTSDADGRFYFNAADGEKLLDFRFGGRTRYKQEILVGPLPPGPVGPPGDVAKVVDRAAMAAIAGPTAKMTRFLAEVGREGMFVFDSANLSVLVAADPQQAIYVAPAAAPTGASGAWVRKFNGPFNVKWFGAKGDGVYSAGTYTGTDDTAAIQTAINYIATTGGTIFFPDGYYVIGGALQDTSFSNAQILLPRNTDITKGPVIRLVGQTPPGTSFASESGAILCSTLSSGTGQVLGAKASSGVTRIALYLENLTIRLRENPTNSGIDLSYVPNYRLENVRVDVPAIAAAIGGIGAGFDVAQPTTATSYGIKGTLDDLATRGIHNNVLVAGFYTGFRVGELAGGDGLSFFACKWAMEFIRSKHPSHFGYVLVCNCPNTLRATDQVVETHIDLLDIEHDTASGGGSGPSWVEPFGYDIDDSFNLLRGEIVYHMHDAGIPFAVNGAKSILIRHAAIEDTAAFAPIYGTFTSDTDLSSIVERRTRTLNGPVPWASLVRNTTVTSGYVGAFTGSNPQTGLTDWRVGEVSMRHDGALNKGKVVISSGSAGGLIDRFAIDSNGDLKVLTNTQHLTQAAQGAIAGIVTMPSGTTFTFSWPRAFNNVPAVVLTPTFDVGSGVRWWYTGTASQCTIHTSSAVAGDWIYHVIGAPD